MIVRDVERRCSAADGIDLILQATKEPVAVNGQMPIGRISSRCATGAECPQVGRGTDNLVALDQTQALLEQNRALGHVGAEESADGRLDHVVTQGDETTGHARIAGRNGTRRTSAAEGTVD